MDGVHGAAEVSWLGDSYDGGSVKENEASVGKSVLLYSYIGVCIGEHKNMHL